MSWFLIALATPLLHSVANFIDKIVLSKYFQNFSLFVFLIYAAFTTTLVLPIFLLFGGLDILRIPLYDILILVGAGMCGAVAIYFYLYALFQEDASVVVPFFQLTPVASFLLARLIIGETLTSYQIIGSAIIILGSIILSFEFEQGQKIRFRSNVVLAVVAMAILVALGSVLFKSGAGDNNFWLSNFWDSLGFAIVCFLIFFFRRKDRHAFYDSLRQHRAKVTGFVLLSEAFTIGGALTLNYAFLLAPIVLVRVVEGYQPIFVLILGILITKFFPRLLQEKMGWHQLLPKIVATVIIVVGSYFILA